jgi:hypothetical protein
MATVAIDMNRTHATNSLWPGHARFHVVWQGSTVVLLSIADLVLIWVSGPYSTGSFYFAALLAAISPIGFLTAFLSRRLFAGTLSDPNGIPPVRVSLFGTTRSIDMNLAAVIAALLALIAILGIYRG